MPATACRTGALLVFAGVVALAMACGSGNSRAAQEPGGAGDGSNAPSGPAGGGGGGETPAPGSPRLDLACAADSVTAGGNAVTCTAILHDASGPVSWTLTGPGQLSAAAGDAIDYVPPASISADAVAEIVATAGTLSQSVQIHVLAPAAPGPITLTGKVVDEYASPLEGETVLLDGHPAATTDAAGAFTVDSVETPYDLVIPREGSRTAFIYQGLTRSDPTVFVYANETGDSGSAAQSTTLTGHVGGGDESEDDRDHYQAVLFASPQVDQGLRSYPPRVSLGELPDDYALPVSWHGSGATTGTLLAIQWRADESTGAPTAYWYAVQEEVTLLPGESQANPAPLKLEANTEAVETKCTVRLPANYDLLANYVGVSFPSRGIAFRLFRDDISAAGLATGEPYTTNYLLPSIPGASVQVCAVASDSRDYFAGSTSVACADATGVSEVVIDVQRSLQPFSPARTANDVTPAMRYAWSGFEGGVHMARFTPLDEGAPRYYVFTAATNAVLPDLSAQKLGLPAGAQYEWDVRGTAPFADLDAFTASAPVVPPFDFAIGTASRSAWSRSTRYGFTTR